MSVIKKSGHSLIKNKIVSFSAHLPGPNKIHQNHQQPCYPGSRAAVEAQHGFPSTWGGICSAAARRLGSTGCLLRVGALSLQFAAGHPGEADSSRVNCFYHKNKCFLSSFSSWDESADRNHTAPRAASAGHAAGCSLSSQRNGWEQQGRELGAWSGPWPLPKTVTP